MSGNKRVLTDAFLKSIKGDASRIEIWDVGNPGFGIRVGTKGGISFQYLYRYEGKARRFALGKYPRVSLQAAREFYHRAAVKVSQGLDPASEHQQLLKERSEAVSIATFCATFIERYAKPRKRSWKEDERQLNRDLIPILGHKMLREVTRKDIARLINQKVDSGSPVAANRLLAVVRRLFGWAVEQGEIDRSPCEGIRMPARETARKRVIQSEEIPTLWHALETGTGIGMSEVVRRLLQVLLLTGQRKGEVIRMRWCDLSFTDRCTWNSPAQNSKNGSANKVPLVGEVVTILDQLRGDKSYEEAKKASPYCFASPKDSLNHISLTAPDHALRNELQRPGSVLYQMARITPHDFRRTVATGLSVLGFNRLIVQKVLNHTDGSVTSVYDRNPYDEEKFHALTKWTEMLLAGTWPAGEDYDPVTGNYEDVWDFVEEWNRMPREVDGGNGESV